MVVKIIRLDGRHQQLPVWDIQRQPDGSTYATVCLRKKHIRVKKLSSTLYQELESVAA